STRSEQFFGPFMAGVSFVSSPNRFRKDFGLHDESGELMCVAALEQEIQKQCPENIAGVIGEAPSRSYGVTSAYPLYCETWDERAATATASCSSSTRL